MKTMGKTQVALQRLVWWHGLPEHLSRVPTGGLMWDVLITTESSPHFAEYLPRTKPCVFHG